jgi:hypothetical protein
VHRAERSPRDVQIPEVAIGRKPVRQARFKRKTAMAAMAASAIMRESLGMAAIAIQNSRTLLL